MNIKLLFCFTLFVSLSGCSQQKVSAELTVKTDQENLCQVAGWQHDVVAEACKPGQKVVFLPKSFGNEQLPILFSAVNCDHRFSIALTGGGVSCIYAPIKLANKEEKK